MYRLTNLLHVRCSSAETTADRRLGRRTDGQRSLTSTAERNPALRGDNGGGSNSRPDEDHATTPEPQEMVPRCGGEDGGRNGMGKDTTNSKKKVQATAVSIQETHTARGQEAKANNVKGSPSSSVIDVAVDDTHAEENECSQRR